ncbi:metal ABC transporter ATP-binding protein [Lactococcus insecticola]|uniref:Zinc ABC transporter ATP-binding protein n=1 Tax=Pseudolactococcus insecticola TaxID=2709158 RepID=A0A6A0B702_9LACT|nr:metal ABC transporter ATP-binding protein [Lactococcus insecticola]GFH41130.1 zinc ABC transporter ATP-binding protein [Lactococcus insecticola]
MALTYLDVKNLSFFFDAEPVLEDVSYSINSGEFVTLTGENGAAKSTLVRASLGIIRAKQGNISIAKKNIKGKKLRISYLPQQIASFNAGFPSTVKEFVTSGRYPRNGWFKKTTAHDLAHVEQSLRSVGMWDQRDKRMGELSGGQKQRIAIARMFASDPDLFVLDEPTTGMDDVSRTEFYMLMHHAAHKHGKAVLMITHDADDVKAFADRNIHLARKQASPWRCFSVHDNQELATQLESHSDKEVAGV